MFRVLTCSDHDSAASLSLNCANSSGTISLFSAVLRSTSSLFPCKSAPWSSRSFGMMVLFRLWHCWESMFVVSFVPWSNFMPNKAMQWRYSSYQDFYYAREYPQYQSRSELSSWPDNRRSVRRSIRRASGVRTAMAHATYETNHARVIRG